ncbi:uncharacterized protein ACNS7B_004578 [Menidia menidia]
MEHLVNKQLYANSLNFKRSLDRIIDKYSKLREEDGGIDVDLSKVKPDTLQQYINLSRKELKTLQSKRLTESSEESFGVQDFPGDAQFDVTHEENGGDETFGSNAQFGVDNHEETVGSLQTSSRSFSESRLQPEDEDEELQMSLSSNGSSLVELYPGMVSRIEKAWRRQRVSEAADSVLRRYRRWRQQPRRGPLDSTFDLTLGPPKGRPGSAPRSAPPVDGLWAGGRTQRPGPARSHQVRVMDFSEASEPEDVPLNRTFTLCRRSPSRPPQWAERASISCGCLSPRGRSLAEASQQRGLLGSSPQRPGRSATDETPSVHCSPLRPSPLRPQALTASSRTPRGFVRRPDCSLDRTGQRSASASLSSPRRPVVQLKMLCPPAPQEPPPLAPTAPSGGGQHTPRRNLSFTSSLPPGSPKKVDEDFLKLYHEFACLNRSPSFSGPPCRLCARSSRPAGGGGHSSSALAALALSPHRPVLRKRHGELAWDDSPRSKRVREGPCGYSPGSTRHRRELLTRCLAPARLRFPGAPLTAAGRPDGPAQSWGRSTFYRPGRSFQEVNGKLVVLPDVRGKWEKK